MERLRYAWQEWIEGGTGHWALMPEGMPEGGEIRYKGLHIASIYRNASGWFIVECRYRNVMCRARYKTLAGARRWALRQLANSDEPPKFK